jgi:transposase
MAKKKINEATIKKVVAAHEAGSPMRKIAKENKISLSSVHRIVKENGPQKGWPKAPKKIGKTERKKRIEKLEARIAELESKILDLEAKKR